MRRKAALLLLALVGIACDSPTAVPSARQRPAFAATSTRTDGTFNQDFTGFIECAGENVRFVFQVPITIHQVSSPNGSHTTTHFVDAGATGTATGLTTGRTWTLKQIALTLNSIDQATGVTHYAGRGIWVSEGGPSIYDFELLKIRVDPNGNLVTEDFTVRFTCH